MIGFEYLQVDHELLGYHRVIPLAFLGSERLEIKHTGIEKWFLDNLWKRGQGYSERGLSVRSRVEQFIVVPNQSYEVVERDKQVYFRPCRAVIRVKEAPAGDGSTNVPLYDRRKETLPFVAADRPAAAAGVES